MERIFLTAIDILQLRHLKNKISEEIIEFTECIEDYLNEKDIKLRTLYWERIKKMLSRESSFAGFKRSIVRESKELMQCFGELLV